MRTKRFVKFLAVGISLGALLVACSSGQQTVTSQTEPPKAQTGGEKTPPPTEPQKGGQVTQPVQPTQPQTQGTIPNPPGGKTASAGNPEPPVVPPAGGQKTAVEGGKIIDTFVDKPELKRVYFEYDKSSITPEAAEILKKNRDYLLASPKARVLIEGHCDERGTVEYNLALGERRANSVRRFLEDLRIDSKRMDTISYGEERPVDPAANEEAWAKNRRAQFKEL